MQPGTLFKLTKHHPTVFKIIGFHDEGYMALEVGKSDGSAFPLHYETEVFKIVQQPKPAQLSSEHKGELKAT